MERAKDRLTLMVPMTILIIFVLLYLAFRRFAESLLILGSLPFALTGGIWLLYLLGDRLSVAVGTGFIALAGLAAEFGVVMIVYLRHAVRTISPWPILRPLRWRRLTELLSMARRFEFVRRP